MVFRMLRAALPWFLLAAGAGAQATEWRLHPGRCVVRHVDVLTMDSPELLRDRDVRIVDGVIRAIEPAAAADPQDTVVDGRGLTLLPGLMDMHVHLNDGEREQQLVLYLAHGVTTVQSMHGTPRHLDVRARLARGDLVGPRFFTTGPTTATEQVDSPAKAAQVVGAQADAGYDAIKMYGDGADTMTRETYAAVIAAAHARGLRVVGHAPRNLPFEVVLAEGQDSIDHMEEILYTATPVLKVMAPLIRFQFGRRNRDEVDKLLAREDLAAGMDAAATEVAAQVKETKLAVTPTLIAFTTILQHTTPEFERLADNPLLACMSPLTRREWEPAHNRYRRSWTDRRDVIPLVLGRGLELQKCLVRAFHAASVPILTGTDAPLTFVYPGWSLHRELGLLVECGLTPYEALVAATVAPARVLRIADQIGTVAVGKQADLVLVRGDPTADVGNAAKVAGVFARGRWFDRPALDAMQRDLAKSYEPLARQLQQVGAPIDAGDVAGAADAFAALEQPDPLLATFVESQINERGYRLLNDKQVDAAIAVFTRNCELFPRAFNAWDSLGEAWMVKGDKVRAISSYEKSLELNPGNANGAAMLRRLREDGR
jgi:imidazolonepropionase-like amidohydrolase